MPRYSSANPITYEMIHPFADVDHLCAGAFGTQSDCQSIGYDRLCAVANLFYDEKDRNGSYNAISKAKDEISDSQYSYGFQKAWDRIPKYELGEEMKNPEFAIGYTHGEEVLKRFNWKWSSPNDCHTRGGANRYFK